ncbi:NAD(P)/FAD-dependent oxidoreductase [Rhodococcus sp. JS3073]|uniref:NAD(P)/FAD-dependent oxidoreductase n=1 Tax=Rhodococcus sp. JS3073 TaxID=3002901 RepID=UPI0022863AF5|nr:FAD-dependent oxidoreductase [Rhodococcus sp. JS3073]WAM19186.1 FAD-dependent oxidoreductase [Rhodococcus sp. JS3073]
MERTSEQTGLNGRVSHWMYAAGETQRPRRAALADTQSADVCIVGGGLTGLWTAYYLKRERPDLDVRILEAKFTGYGASGRNGGWVSGLLPGSRERMAQTHGREAVVRLQHEMDATVDEFMSVIEDNNIEAGAQKGGTLRVARLPAQAARLRELKRLDDTWGTEGVEILSSAELRRRANVDGALLGYFNPHCARLDPGRVVQGLSEVVERLGVTIYEDSEVLRIRPGQAITGRGSVRSRWVVQATEAYSAHLPGQRRSVLPISSSMIVTEPISDAAWQEIGWNGGETLADAAHMFCYAQRTEDNRIAIGSEEPAPYRFGSRLDGDGEISPKTVEVLRRTLIRVFPHLSEVRVAHAWSGNLAVPRDWSASIQLDADTGLGWAGGYSGHGVATTNLAARTMRDLILGKQTSLTRAPWVGHISPNWEPEPIRWLGSRMVHRAFWLADRHEAKGRATTSPIARAASRVARMPFP